MSPIWTKLNLKSQKEIVVLNAPADFERELKGLQKIRILRQPVRAKEQSDFVLLFATNSRELESAWKRIVPTLKTDAVFWIGSPKKSSGIQSDLVGMSNGWSIYAGSPWQPVASISINEAWTARRFRYAPGLEQQRKERGDEEIRDLDGTVVVDRINRVVHPPADLGRVLLKHPGARTFFERLSFTNQKEYVVWIVEAKKKETRDKRLELALEKLVSEKKNPSEK
jgi:hypothetical protein